MECVCNSPLHFNIDFHINPSSTVVCCPANSANINGKCECDYSSASQPFYEIKSIANLAICVYECPPNSSPNSKGICTCISGMYEAYAQISSILNTSLITTQCVCDFKMGLITVESTILSFDKNFDTNPQDTLNLSAN